MSRWGSLPHGILFALVQIDGASIRVKGYCGGWRIANITMHLAAQSMLVSVRHREIRVE